ncbi:protein dispatched homolog 1-like [Nematostella vectensis]|uniref:protein dispatched homolog 1-like n=1 Tax=Nematostella vectensis TaxID=45351 RepID=UPI0020775C30|nr:protein dispatched homolog 1-like [Nematostella vectensis]XP_048586599.1 protein dispatched homolog 1-like [Nematostella vectensis]XP_048586600.1 protein dispatched homolog 1-like [Nematostella vectensis]
MHHPAASPRIHRDPCTEKKDSQSEKQQHFGRFSYSVLVADYPFVVFFVTLAVIIVCALCDFVPLFGAPDFPDFSTPVMGFEARGTMINKRWRTRLFLKFAIDRQMFLPVPPLNKIPREIFANSPEYCPHLNLSFINSKASPRFTRQKRSTIPEKPGPLRMCDSPNVYMKSRIEYKTIYGPKETNGNIMTAESLKAVCRLESKIMRDFTGFREACFRRNITIHGLRKEECCPSWSVGNYVASLSGRQTCQDVTDEDVKEVMTRLKSCAKFFNNGTLKENCWDYKNSLPYPYCVNIPLACVKDNAVFIILYYLTDKEFLGTDMQEHLSYTQAFTPRWHRGEYSKAIYYRYLEGKTMEDGPVRLVGTNFYFLKFSMFNTKLLADIIYPSIALMIILIIMWFYTESILITILLAVSVVSALILAYFVNMIILRLNFFPFLNITTLIFLVGIGADDAFVFCDVWRQSKRDHPGASLKTVTYTTLRHASTSMFVTSFTTAAAFVANFSSEITTIKLFGLYAGVAILAKFLLMVTWFPAMAVINERYCSRRACKKREDEASYMESCCCKVVSKEKDKILTQMDPCGTNDTYFKSDRCEEIKTSACVTSENNPSGTRDTYCRNKRCRRDKNSACATSNRSSCATTKTEENYQSRKHLLDNGDEVVKADSSLAKFRVFYESTVTQYSRYVFEEALPNMVIKYRFLWITICSLLTALGMMVLLAHPGLQFPTSADFQMFSSSHPLEAYELNFKKKFRFEMSPSQESVTFPIDIFWGVEPEDYGDSLDPYDYGKFGWDKTFDFINPDSQKWFMEFCRRFRGEEFFAKKAGSEKQCFLEVFYNQSCMDEQVPELCNYPCCRNSFFPYSLDVLNFCTLSSAYKKRILRFRAQDNTLGSFIYDTSGNLKGLWVRIMSNIRLSRAYQPAHTFWHRIESWAQKEMRSAPPGMRKGWFMSDLEYYNLQRSLSRGTLLSMSISIATAFAVMLLTTWNVLVSVYAILSIIGTISVTIGALVLNGWKLNILESITMSVAVGVSIDFSMHFGVAFCLAPDKHDRKSRVRYSMSRMGSAITMAAVTTFIAGAMMMPSDVLSYIQMGHFLMLVMAVSWFFSIFFFQALCATIGPQGDMGQLNLHKLLSGVPCFSKRDSRAFGARKGSWALSTKSDTNTSRGQGDQDMMDEREDKSSSGLLHFESGIE